MFYILDCLFLIIILRHYTRNRHLRRLFIPLVVFFFFAFCAAIYVTLVMLSFRCGLLSLYTEWLFFFIVKYFKSRP